MSNLGRREFLRGAGITGAGLLGFYGLSRRYDFSRTAWGASSESSSSILGPLLPAKTNNTGETFLALPKDFQYTVIGKTGSRMSDGKLTPSDHDGMAAFQINGELRLVRNHEVDIRIGAPGAAIGPNAFDPLAASGVTTLVIDPKTRQLVRDFVSLSGTVLNCAGGRTPWNTWISCEETVLGKEKSKNEEGREQGEFQTGHGYCFEVPAVADKAVVPAPLKEMGRFTHEAVAVDTQTGIVYLTEDLPTAGFYRFIPKKQGQLAAGGRLQMLAVKDRPNFDTRTQQKSGVALAASWVEIENPDPPDAESDSLAVYKQGFAAGAATFARLEGCFYGNGRVYFTATTGGDKQLGQVWEYTPSGKGEGKLTLVFEPDHSSVLNMPDNICLAGRNLIICEDNDHSNYLRVLTPQGQLSNLALNVAPGFGTKEFAGLTFSPDGQTLFVNLQIPGMTLAIWGPWERIM